MSSAPAATHAVRSASARGKSVGPPGGIDTPKKVSIKMMKRGALYEVATLPFLPHVVEDGQLITGQNPASARGVGQAVVRKLRAAEQTR